MAEEPKTPGTTAPRRAESVPLTDARVILTRAALRYRDAHMTDWSAALTYYGLLALFPTLIALIAVLAIVGRHPETTNALLDIVGDVGSDATVDAVREPLQSVIENKGGAGALLGVGLAAALVSASGYIGAFSRAANVIWQVEEGRPFWQWKPLQVLITILMIVLLAAVGIGVVISGPLAAAVGEAIGVGDGLVTLWSIAKWPAILLLVVALVSVLYWSTPNVRRPERVWLSAGALLAIVVWVIASALFAVYVSRFGSYNATYGSIGGIVILMVWMWITNNALLFGAQVDAEIERQREIRATEPGAEVKIQLPERRAPKA